MAQPRRELTSDGGDDDGELALAPLALASSEKARSLMNSRALDGTPEEFIAAAIAVASAPSCRHSSNRCT